MRYSKFNEQTGMYDVYQDAKKHALNADLPVPKLPAPTNGIGVPARNAGRPLPLGAKLIGQSWQPQGVVVTSVKSGMAGFGEMVPEEYVPHAWVGGGVALGGIAGLTKDNVIGGMVAGGLVGYLGYMLVKKKEAA